MTMQTQKFQAEIKEILDLMVNSLYSKREIFLRELVSNSSDALDKLRFEEAKDSSLETKSETKHIRLAVDKDNRTLTIVDNGIGMDKDDVINNIGTIAHSGTKEFLKKAKEAKESGNPELIGQFGVGFYSAFMVADEVTIETQKVGATDGVKWTSKGDGEYSVEDSPRKEGHGTTITLKLKQLDTENEDQDFTEEWVLRSIIKKYSDFIEWPIMMQVERDEPKLDEEGKEIEGQTITTTKDETLNSQKALWLRSASDVTKEEYNEFYKHVASDWNEPLETIHYKAEGTQEFSSILFIPSQAPMDYNYREAKTGLSLYVKRVFIADNVEELVPPFLRFLKGVVDSSDLPLNVSREILQKDRQIKGISKAVVSKVLKSLKTMLEKDREKYEKFWSVFGPTLKEGIVSDFTNKDKVTELSLFHTGNDKLVTLKEYVANMKEGQKSIYYITGDNVAQLSSSPYLEKLNKRGYEVIYLIDHVDEWVANTLTEFDGKKLVAINGADLDIDSEEDKKKAEKELNEKKDKFSGLTSVISSTLEKDIQEVRLSDRLVDSPVCLVAAEGGPSAHLEKMMAAMGQEAPKAKKILEINADHPVFEKMNKASESTQKLWAQILYNQALLNEGSTIEDPTLFTKQVAELMVNANI